MITEICLEELGFLSLVLYWLFAAFAAGNVYNSTGLGIYILQVLIQHMATLPQKQNTAKEHATKLEPRECHTEERPEYILPYRI
jgi:hypothetical protein